MKFKAVKIKNKTRLDKFLVDKLPDLSRSKIQKLIRDQKVLINKMAPKNGVHTFLEPDDSVEVTITAQKTADYSLWKKIEIIKETENFLIIDKPSGLLVHQTEKKETNTLSDWLLKNFPQTKDVGQPFRPGIVHRLDKDVSGIMVIAKNQETYLNLKKQFKERQTKKIYIALVYNTFEQKNGEISFKIARAKSGKMVSRPLSQEGKESKTKYQVLSELKNYTILKLEPQTGRTHQLRSHLQAITHPIVGDPIYKPKKVSNRFNLKRPFLHAYSLGFYDLNKNWQQFYCVLPKKLIETIIKLI